MCHLSVTCSCGPFESSPPKKAKQHNKLKEQTDVTFSPSSSTSFLSSPDPFGAFSGNTKDAMGHGHLILAQRILAQRSHQVHQSSIISWLWSLWSFQRPFACLWQNTSTRRSLHPPRSQRLADHTSMSHRRSTAEGRSVVSVIVLPSFWVTCFMFLLTVK